MFVDSIFVSAIRKRLHRRVLIPILMVVLIGCLSVVLGVKALNRGGQKVSTYSSTSGKGKSGQKIQAEIVTITTRGFGPAEITRSAGPFLLVIEKEGRIQNLDLTLDRDDGENVHKRKLDSRNLNLREIVDLRPGHYTLKDINHPNLVCRINITSK